MSASVMIFFVMMIGGGKWRTHYVMDVKVSNF